MRIAFVGFGNVGQAFAALLAEKRSALRRIGFVPIVTGICTRRQGGIIRQTGLPLTRAAPLLRSNQSLDAIPHDRRVSDTQQFLRKCPADVVNSTTNYLLTERQRGTDPGQALKQAQN